MLASTHASGLLQQGIDDYNKGKTESARVCLEKEVAANPKSETAYYYLSVIYVGMGKLDAAAACLKKLIGINYYYRGAHYALGEVYKKQGAFAEAVDEYAKSIKVEPTARAYFNIGVLRAKMQDYDEAVYAFRKSLGIDRHNVYTHYNLGNVYEAKGALREALDEYKQVLRHRPKFVMAHYHRGAVLERLQRDEEAVVAFITCVEIDKSFAPGYLALALTYEKMGRKNDAVKYYRRYAATETDPAKKQEALRKARDLTAGGE
jgi:tetratricopeptide (TPR) repeat protein